LTEQGAQPSGVASKGNRKKMELRSLMKIREKQEQAGGGILGVRMSWASKENEESDARQLARLVEEATVEVKSTNPIHLINCLVS